MRKLFLSLFVIATCIQAATNEHFQGSWKLDPAKSTQTPGMELRAMVLTFEGDEVTIAGETGKGEPIKANFVAKADGKEYATTNTPDDPIIVKQVDADHQIVTFKKDGKIQSISHVE